MHIDHGTLDGMQVVAFHLTNSFYGRYVTTICSQDRHQARINRVVSIEEIQADRDILLETAASNHDRIGDKIDVSPQNGSSSVDDCFELT